MWLLVPLAAQSRSDVPSTASSHFERSYHSTSNTGGSLVRGISAPPEARAARLWRRAIWTGWILRRRSSALWLRVERGTVEPHFFYGRPV